MINRYIAMAFLTPLILIGCTTNNSKNVQDVDERQIRPSLDGEHYDITKASETSMLKSKEVALEEASAFCADKEKKLLPNRVDLGITTGWFLPRKSYELNFLCADSTRINPLIDSVNAIASPPKGKAGIFLIRPPGFIGDILLYDITIDGKEAGTLGIGNFLYGHLQPGPHVLSAKIDGDALSLNINLNMNENLFLTISPGWTNLSVDEIDSTKAAKYLASFSHSQDNMFKDMNKFP